MNITWIERDWCLKLVTASNRTSGWGLSSLFNPDMLINIFCIFWGWSFRKHSELKSKFWISISFILVSLHLTRSSLFSEMCSLYFISSELLLRPSCCFKWLSSPIAQLIFSLERLQWFIDCYAGCEIFAYFPANNKCLFFQVMNE